MNKNLFFLALTALLGTSSGCGSDMNGIWKQLKKGDDLSGSDTQTEEREAGLLLAGLKESDGSRSDTQAVKREADILSSQLELDNDENTDLDVENAEDHEYGAMPDNMLTSNALTEAEELSKTNKEFETLWKAMQDMNEKARVSRVKANRGEYSTRGSKAKLKSNLRQVLVRLSDNIKYKKTSNKELTSDELSLLKKHEINLSNEEQRRLLRKARLKLLFDIVDDLLRLEQCKGLQKSLQASKPALDQLWGAVDATAERAQEKKAPDGYNSLEDFKEDHTILKRFYNAVSTFLEFQPTK